MVIMIGGFHIFPFILLIDKWVIFFFFLGGVLCDRMAVAMSLNPEFGSTGIVGRSLSRSNSSLSPLEYIEVMRGSNGVARMSTFSISRELWLLFLPLSVRQALAWCG